MNLIIAIIGLGYVGLPLAVAFSKHFKIIGFDKSEKRINELKKGIDITNEVQSNSLKNIDFTTDPKRIGEADFIILALPTPIRSDYEPDISFIESAARIVGGNMKKGAIVILESTVYPGLTEEVLIPILEEESSFKCGEEFKVGYSPERINPGDKEHTVENIVKIVSGCDEIALTKIADLYSSIVKAGVFKAKSIKVAEAAKVIENIQRDLNIALMNELSIIFSKDNISTKEVIEAASTKWNFHRYTPGLVGGHCIGKDSYYLVYRAKKLNHEPKMILAGRDVNVSMVKHTADMVINYFHTKGVRNGRCNILILGLSFKENVSDIRNSKAKELIYELRRYDFNVFAFDPLVAEEDFNSFNVNKASFNDKYDCIVLFSPHKIFFDKGLKYWYGICTATPLFFDIKGFFNKEDIIREGFDYLSL